MEVGVKGQNEATWAQHDNFSKIPPMNFIKSYWHIIRCDKCLTRCGLWVLCMSDDMKTLDCIIYYDYQFASAWE
jgi:hypothetical protein